MATKRLATSRRVPHHELDVRRHPVFLRVSRAGLGLALRARLTAARRHTRVGSEGFEPAAPPSTPTSSTENSDDHPDTDARVRARARREPALRRPVRSLVAPAPARPQARGPRLHGRAPDGRGGPRPAHRRRPHHPQRGRPRHRRRDPLAGHQPAPARHRGGHRHRAHRLRDAHVPGRRRSTASSSSRRAATSTSPFHAFPDLESNLREQVEPDPGRIRGSRTCRCTAWSTRSRRGACARSSDPPGRGHEDARRGTDPSRGSSSIGSVASTRHTPFG